MNHNNISKSKELIMRSLKEVPSKQKSIVLIELAKFEEYNGNLNKARYYLKESQIESKNNDWKVFLESILLEIRNKNIDKAIFESERALKIHKRTGRLWAILIQLMYIQGEKKQIETFKTALLEVPKSGEVWCEGARIYLNPTYSVFNLQKAQKYLDFAVQFTPQYGDSFIEYLKLQYLLTGSFSNTYSSSPSISPSNSTLSLTTISNANNNVTYFMSSSNSFSSTFSNQMESNIEKNNESFIENLCINSEPNYGPLWFYCKFNILENTKDIFKNSKNLIVNHLFEFKNLYQNAILKNNYYDFDQYEKSDFISALPFSVIYQTEKKNDLEKKKLIFGFTDNII
jgi:tetratricopeptide (TPR) repeat protein